MSDECQVHIKSQSELDIGGRETCFDIAVCVALTATCNSYELNSSRYKKTLVLDSPHNVL